jgi:hypothetical protein
MTQAAALKALPIRVSRTLATVMVSIAVVGLFVLAFGVGRWTAAGGTSSTTQNVGPAVQPAAPAVVHRVVPPVECHVTARPC